MAKQLTTEELYNKAKQLMNSTDSIVKNSDKAKIYNIAAKRFQSLGEFNDSPALAEECLKLASEFKAKPDVLPPHPVNPLDLKDKSKLSVFMFRLVFVLVIAMIIWQVYARTTDHGRYLRASFYSVIGQNEKAAKMFTSLKNYKDSPDKVIDNSYETGLKKYDDKNYKEAVHYFRQSLNYKDTNKYLTKAELVLIKKAKVNTDVLYGEAHWVIVKKKDGKAFMIKTKPINGIPYHTEEKDVTWETSSVRDYVNTDYANEIFTSEMIDNIAVTTVKVKGNDIYHTKGCTTKDKLFFLNAMQAYKYCMEKPLSDFKRDFWLIEPGETQSSACFFSFGQVMNEGYNVTSSYINIRPAMWVEYK